MLLPFSVCQFNMLRGEKDKVGRDDMVTLASITEEEMLGNLRKRYLEGVIYVSRILCFLLFLQSINSYSD